MITDYMAHTKLPLPFQQLYPTTATNPTSKMPYTQLLHMSSSGEQTNAGLYQQQSEMHDFGLPSAGSLDSGYGADDAESFEKAAQFANGASHMDFDRNCSIDTQSDNLAFGNFAYVPPALHANTSDFGMYSATGLTAPFQPDLGPTEPFSHWKQSPSMEDVSEDGHSPSICSNSPHQATFAFDASPQQQQRSLWSHRPDTLKRQATDSSAEANCAPEDRQPVKSTARGRPRKRIPHTAVERRYRENLNMHLEKLRAAVPNLTAAQRRRSNDGSDALKPSKCEVLMGAVEYIKRLETENEQLKRKA